MTAAYVLRMGKGKSALYLSNAPFDSTRFSLTENRHEALALPRHEAEEIAAMYRQGKADFDVVELHA